MDKLQISYLSVVLIIISALFCLISCEGNHDTSYYFNLQKRFIQGSVQEQTYLDKVLELDSLHVEALVEKSVAFNKRGQYAIGMHYLNKGVELDPKEHLGYRGFVKLYMFRDYKGALQDFLRLDSLTPQFRDAPWGEDIYKVIGLSYMGMNMYDPALENLNRSVKEIAIDEGEDWIEPRTFMYRGICFMKRGEVDLAILSFNKQIQYCNECPSGYYYKAKTLIDAKSDKVEEIENLLDRTSILVKENLIESSPYFELPYQIYPSDIEELKKKFLHLKNEIIKKPL